MRGAGQSSRSPHNAGNTTAATDLANATAAPPLLTTGLDLGDCTTHRCTLDVGRRVTVRGSGCEQEVRGGQCGSVSNLPSRALIRWLRQGRSARTEIQSHR
jgi:hypothetical protein